VGEALRTGRAPSWLALAVGAVLLAGVSALAGAASGPGAGAVAAAPGTTLLPGSSSSSAASSPTTTTTTTAPTTTTTVAPAVVDVGLTRPSTPPDDPYADEPHVVVGRIEIPKLGLDVPLNQGIALTSIDRGPSHWPGTALPGQFGNVVVAGHRVTHTSPFRHIDQLGLGDEVVLTGEHGRFVYRVTETDVVTPDAMHIVDQTPDHTATLFACHPPGSAAFRYVVKLALDDAHLGAAGVGPVR
jgi:sortase A